MAILISAFVHVSAQKSDKKDEQFKEITALIESGRYMFTVQSVQPTGARTIHVQHRAIPWRQRTPYSKRRSSLFRKGLLRPVMAETGALNLKQPLRI